MKSFCMLAAFAAVLFVAGCSSDDGEKEVFVTSIEITVQNQSTNIVGTTVKIDPKVSITFVATCLPENATNTRYSWSSEKEDIATVNAGGMVTALKSGDTKIICTSADGKAEAFVNLHVNDVDFGLEVAGEYDGMIGIRQGGVTFAIPFPITLEWVSQNKVSFEGEAMFPSESLSNDEMWLYAISAGVVPSHIPIGMITEMTINWDEDDEMYYIQGGGSITLPEKIAEMMGLEMAGSTFDIIREWDEDEEEFVGAIPYITKDGEIYMRFEIFGLGESFYSTVEDYLNGKD